MDYYCFPTPRKDSSGEASSGIAMSETLSPVYVREATPPPARAKASSIERKAKRDMRFNDMIDNAIYEKAPRGKGLSLVAIKNFLQEKYFVNIKRSAKTIRECIKESVSKGRLIQVTGRGANGSFRLDSKVRTMLNERKKSSEASAKKGETKKSTTGDVQSQRVTRKRRAESVDSDEEFFKRIRTDS